MSIKCKKCGNSKLIKNGLVLGKQRYRCKECNFNFRIGDKREKYSDKEKMRVIELYLENCGIRSIERITGIYNNLISHWIKRFSSIIKNNINKDLEKIKSKQDIQIMEIDELVTYIKKNQKMAENISLYGLLSTEKETKLLILK
jgi:transposase-like protein